MVVNVIGSSKFGSLWFSDLTNDKTQGDYLIVRKSMYPELFPCNPLFVVEKCKTSKQAKKLAKLYQKVNLREAVAKGPRHASVYEVWYVVDDAETVVM